MEHWNTAGHVFISLSLSQCNCLGFFLDPRWIRRDGGVRRHQRSLGSYQVIPRRMGQLEGMACGASPQGFTSVITIKS